MRHTFPLVGKQGEGEVVDASYSQFFQYVGMSVMHEKRMGIPVSTKSFTLSSAPT